MDDFSLRAIALAVACNVCCAVLGCYLVLRRMSLIGDAISHAVLPGIALAFLLTGQVSGIAIVVGAMLVGLLTAFLTQLLYSSGKVAEDSSLGIVYTALFAVGVLMIKRAGNVDLDADCVLFGNLVLAATDTESWFGLDVPVAMRGAGFTLALTLGFVLLFWKELKITSFDPALATAIGIRASVIHYLLMALVGGVTVAAFEAVGSVLVIAMLIVPACCGHLLSDRLVGMMLWAAAAATTASVLGYFGAETWNTSPAGMMATVAGLLFLACVLFAPRHGLLSKLIRTFKLGQRIVSEDVLALLYRREESLGGETVVPLAEVRQRAKGWRGRLALSALRRDGLLLQRAGSLVGLSDAGRRRGESLVRAHRLWEAYLGENLALAPDHLHEPAERMEHFIGPELQQELAFELQQPAVDPHGKKIPPA